MEVYDSNGLWNEQGCPHYDAQRNHRWTGPWNPDDERGKTVAQTKTKRKVRRCEKCGKVKRDDGANDSCVCRETGANRRQSILFADEREKSYRQAALRDLEDDIAWLMEQWKKEADEDGYHAAW
jgi:hypothetical protein